MISLKNPVGQHSIMEVSPLLLSIVSNSIIVIIEGVHKILTTVMTREVVNKSTNYAKPRSIRYPILTRGGTYPGNILWSFRNISEGRKRRTRHATRFDKLVIER